MRLAAGSAVRIDDTAGNAVAGRLVHVDGDGVAIAAGSSPRTFLRAQVQRLSVITRLTARKAKIGWLTGTIAGGLLAALVVESNRLPWTALMSAGWGVMGAGIGASDGFFDRQESLVYQAPPTFSPSDHRE